RRVEHLVEVDAREGLAVPAVGRGVAQHALDLVLLRAVVAATLAKEGPADVAVEIDGLARARVLRDLEGEYHLAVVLVAVLRNVDVVVHLLPSVQHREEIVLERAGGPSVLSTAHSPAMGLLTFSLNLTLDGCVDHQEGIADDETHAFFTRLMDEGGAMLWGRVTYEMMESYWPAVARGDEEAPPAIREWAVKLEAKPKYVVSSTR